MTRPPRWLEIVAYWLPAAVGIPIAAYLGGTGWAVLLAFFSVPFALIATLNAFGLVHPDPRGGGWVIGTREPAESRVERRITALSESTSVITEIEREVRQGENLLSAFRLTCSLTRSCLS